MKGQKKKKHQREQSNSLQRSAMPTAEEVAAERASEAAYEQELAALLREGAPGEGSDSGGSESEARLRSALRRLPAAPPARCAPAPAAATLPQLAAALRPAHPRDVRFLDEYGLLLAERSEAELRAVNEELVQSVWGALAAGGGEGGVVLASWLAAAVTWRAPRVPGALHALHGLLHHLTPNQVKEVARALHSALEVRALVAASDAVRGARGGLSTLLLRAALSRLAARAPAWRGGPPGAGEVRVALAGRWRVLGADDQLAALALAGRALAAGERGEAAALLASLAPPRPKDMQDPDYLKVSGAVKTLQNLFKQL